MTGAANQTVCQNIQNPLTPQPPQQNNHSVPGGVIGPQNNGVSDHPLNSSNPPLVTAHPISAATIHRLTTQQASYQRKQETRTIGQLNCEVINGQGVITLHNIHGLSNVCNTPSPVLISELHQDQLLVKNPKSSLFDTIKIKFMHRIDLKCTENIPQNATSAPLLSFLVEFYPLKDFTRKRTTAELASTIENLVVILKSTLPQLDNILSLNDFKQHEIRRSFLEDISLRQTLSELFVRQKETFLSIYDQTLNVQLRLSSAHPTHSISHIGPDSPAQTLLTYYLTKKNQYITFHATLTLHNIISSSSNRWTTILSDFKGPGLQEFFGNEIPEQMDLKKFIPDSLQTRHEREISNILNQLTRNSNHASNWDNVFLGMLFREQLVMKHPRSPEVLKVYLEMHPKIEKTLNSQTSDLYLTINFNIPKIQNASQSLADPAQRELETIIDAIQNAASNALALYQTFCQENREFQKNQVYSKVSLWHINAQEHLDTLDAALQRMMDVIVHIMQLKATLYSSRPCCHTEQSTLEIYQHSSADHNDEQFELVHFKDTFTEYFDSVTTQHDCDVSVTFHMNENLLMIYDDFEKHCLHIQKKMQEALFFGATSFEITCFSDCHLTKIDYCLKDNRNNDQQKYLLRTTNNETQSGFFKKASFKGTFTPSQQPPSLQ